MAVEIGARYKENLYRVKALASLVIGGSRNRRLTHVIINRHEGLQVVVSQAEENARCYQCCKHIADETIRVEIISEYGKKKEKYYFHASDLFC